ncbi:hypothetical protein RGO69_001302 [Morganella morganii]|nr:hypothetical protein [Morganella morganii]
MSVMNKPDYKIFAQDAKSGEYVAFPDILRGWGITLDQYNGFPPMELFNSAAKRIDEWLMYLTQRGLPEWDAAVDYPKDAMIQHAGVYYVSLKVTKGEQPNNSQASWKKLTEALGVDGKLAKDQNGEDIPNKDTFIKNLGLPEKFQPKGNYAVTNAASTQLFTGPVISSDTVGAQNADGKLKSFLFNSGGAAPAWGATANGRYAGALIHPLKDGTAATTDDVKEVKGLALGVGQAWQIVTRGNGATNTNNTGRTITVNVIRYTGVRGRVSVNGISVAAFRGGRTDTSPAVNVDMTVTAIVPPGAKYIISWDKDVADAGEPEIVELR